MSIFPDTEPAGAGPHCLESLKKIYAGFSGGFTSWTGLSHEYLALFSVDYLESIVVSLSWQGAVSNSCD